MRTKFIKDLEYDAFFVWVMLRNEDPSGVANRAKRMGVNKELLTRIYGTKIYEEVKELIKTFAQEQYEEKAEAIDNAIFEYQKAWDKIDEYFFTEIERITETRWKFPEYKVVLSPFHPGVSNRGGDTVIRWIYEDPEEQKRITAHEILMTHIWNILDNEYPESKDDKLGHFWALNEITTVALLGIEPTLNKLWPLQKQGYDNYLSNYPQLKKLHAELKDIYINKKNFFDYLDKAVGKLEKEYKDINLSIYKK